MTWPTDTPTQPGFYWMKTEGMKSRVVEINEDQHHGLYIVQSGRALADIPDHDRVWAGPLDEP
jgi:hypothetical protein